MEWSQREATFEPKVAGVQRADFQVVYLLLINDTFYSLFLKP